MGRTSKDAYDYALGLREVETGAAETFAAEFPVVTGRRVEILSAGEAPDRMMLIDGVETGVELTLIKAGDADAMISEMLRLAAKKHKTYSRRGIFAAHPLMLLGQLDWPAKDVEGLALYDVHEELAVRLIPRDFSGFGFSEIWLMDDSYKYSARRHPGLPADFFCFAPAEHIGFCQNQRKRRPYWGLMAGY